MKIERKHIEMAFENKELCNLIDRYLARMDTAIFDTDNIDNHSKVLVVMRNRIRERTVHLALDGAGFGDDKKYSMTMRIQIRLLFDYADEILHKKYPRTKIIDNVLRKVKIKEDSCQ